MDVLKTMRLARVGCLCNNDGKHAPIIDALDSSIKAVAELIGAAERITPFASDEQWKRFYAARAAVTAHPNDAEGRM